MDLQGRLRGRGDEYERAREMLSKHTNDLFAQGCFISCLRHHALQRHYDQGGLLSPQIHINFFNENTSKLTKNTSKYTLFLF